MESFQKGLFSHNHFVYTQTPTVPYSPQIPNNSFPPPTPPINSTLENSHTIENNSSNQNFAQPSDFLSPIPPPPPSISLPPPTLPQSSQKKGSGIGEALKRRENVKLVNNKERILEIMKIIQSIEFNSEEEGDEISDFFKKYEAELNELGLSATGENWNERVVIKKKGGGFHFSDEERELAGQAYFRFSSIFFVNAWTQTLKNVLNSTLSSNFSGDFDKTRAERIKRLGQVFSDACKSLDTVFKGDNFQLEIKNMAQNKIPQKFDKLKLKIYEQLKL